MLNDKKHQIYFTDCKKGLEKLPGNSIDLVVSGPPYFNHIIYSGEKGNLSTKEYYDFLDSISKIWAVLEPKLKDGAVVSLWLHDIYRKNQDFFELIPFHNDIIKTIPEGLKLRSILIWDRYLKKTYPGLPTQQQFGTRFQYILLFSKGKTMYENKLKDFYWQPIWFFKTTPRFLGFKWIYGIVFQIGKIPFLYKIFNPVFSKTKKIFFKDKYEFKDYQTTCPPEVAEMLIKNFSKEKDAVCDPFLGSGTTLEACEKLKRICIGFEINKEAKRVILEKVSSQNIEIFE